MDFSSERLQQVLASLPKAQCFWVAYSGGLDSTVLLYALSTLSLNADIKVIHIHHGLQNEADQWAIHCELICKQLGVNFQLVKVNANATKGESPEAAAREARYAAIADLISSGDCLLTAQHQDDQAETLLLQLIRGGGVQGLAAMPLYTEFADGHHARPLLSFSRKSLNQYAVTHNLQWIEDPSNQELQFDRNYLRQQITPLLEKRWPSFAKTLQRTAVLQAEAADLLHELGAIDIEAVWGDQEGTLSIDRLSILSNQRQRNVLRYWIMQHQAQLPSAAILQEIQNIQAAKEDSMPLVSWQDYEVRRYRDNLYFTNSLQHDATQVLTWDIEQPLYIESLGVTLYKQDLIDIGLSVNDLPVLEVRFRQGGERIQLSGRNHSHSLKKLLQEQGVPPWLRERLPICYQNGQLVAVLGVKPAFIAVN